MERDIFQIPDAINKSIEKNYTQIPNDLLRNPDISAKAKAILCILLSNRDGWKSCVPVIQSMMLEGVTAINNAISELTKMGYLKKIRYRNMETKQVVSSFWAYTDVPYQFSSLNDIKALLRNKNLEMMTNDLPEKSHVHGNPHDGNPHDGNPHDGNPHDGNQRLNKTNPNNTNKEEEKDIIVPDENPMDIRNEKYVAVAKYLKTIVQSSKNIKIKQSQITTWSNTIRLMVDIDGIDVMRIRRALNWYKQNVGKPFIVVIESGDSLRAKFTKLEDAIKREQQIKSNNQPRNAYHSKVKPKYPESKLWTGSTTIYDRAKEDV